MENGKPIFYYGRVRHILLCKGGVLRRVRLQVKAVDGRL